MPYFRLNELVEVTGVSPRTIRYYIAEGLLPPPQGAGPAAVYTAGHRDRLLLIGRWKERHLSLREIRRRLAGLGDAKVRAELATGDAAEASPPAIPPEEPSASPPPAASSPAPVVPPPAREHWERVVLADGIELHIRDDRRHERLLLDALIRQARALLGEP